jgi:hypothetical protein
MHDPVLTASNMIKRNWPCNHNCALCLCIHETTEHLLTNCNFTEAAWNQVASNFALPSYNDMLGTGGGGAMDSQVNQWGLQKREEKKTWYALHFWWLIWKERNKRIF